MSRFSELFSSIVDRDILQRQGESTVYIPRAGESYTLTGVPDFGEAVQDQRVYMTLWAPITSFTGGEPAKGDTLTYSGVTYRVSDVDKDASGGRLLKLSVTNP